MAEPFEISRTVEIFQGDSEYLIVLNNAGKTLTDQQYDDLAEILIDNNTHIADNTVVDLIEEGYLNSDFNAIYGGDSAGLYKQTFYTYKYAAVKNFFRNNYHYYLPEFDRTQINSQEKTKLFVEAFMREFDRFSLVIDKLYDIVDINQVPTDYLDYLAQLIGYEREDYRLISDISFRELLKNMIEIYKIKGSNYSFELFFNFLGFDIEVQEFWFDKRYGDDNINSNPYTTSVDKNSYLFYLTPIKPTDGIPDNMNNPYYITEDQIKETLDLNMFDQYTTWYSSGDSRGYSRKQLLGDTPGFDGDTYTFFKSNIIQYKLSTLGTEQESELTDEDTEIIELYTTFLTPIFINPRLKLAAVPYKTYGSGLTIKDYDRLDPIYQGYKSNNHTWSFRVTNIDVDVGDTFTQRSSITVYDPDSILYNNIKYYDIVYLTGDTNGDTLQGEWPIYGDTPGDTAYCDFGDTYLGDTYKYHSGNDTTIFLAYKLTYAIGDTSLQDRGDSGAYVKTGGPQAMFYADHIVCPSNYYIDTQDIFYDKGDSFSVYSRIERENPTWTEEQIMDKMASLDKDSEQTAYGAKPRDLLVLVDAERFQPSGDSNSGDSWLRYYAYKDGDSVWHYSGGFMNPTDFVEHDLGDVNNITLGMNMSLQDEGNNRIFERTFDDTNRAEYYTFDFSYSSGSFSVGDTIFGADSNARTIVTAEGGDSVFYALEVYGNFDASETIYNSNGDSATLSSITKYTDKRRKILKIDVAAKQVHVYDPDELLSNATTNDFLKIFRPIDKANEGSYIISSISDGDVDGDTTIITLGDSLQGDSQNVEGGYAYIDNISRIKSIDAVNGNGKGEITVFDTSRRFEHITEGDTIQIIHTGDSNEGYYTVGTTITHTRSGTQDVDGITTIELGDSLVVDGDSVGYVRIYKKYWTLNNTSYIQNEYLQFVSFR